MNAPFSPTVLINPPQSTLTDVAEQVDRGTGRGKKFREAGERKARRNRAATPQDMRAVRS